MTSVLIIDDNPFIAQGCRRLLEAAGIGEILSADNLAGGFELYQQNRPDVVVLDLSFKDGPLAGLSLVQRINAEGAGARIVIFSMHDDPAIMEHCMNAGASSYVVKDTSAAELVRVVLGDATASSDGDCEI